MALDPETPTPEGMPPLVVNYSVGSLVSVYLVYFKPIRRVLNEFDDIPPPAFALVFYPDMLF